MYYATYFFNSVPIQLKNILYTNILHDYIYIYISQYLLSMSLIHQRSVEDTWVTPVVLPQPPERDLLSGSSQWEQHSILCILSQLGLELEGKTAMGCRFRLGISEGHYKEGKNHFYLHKSVVRGETRDNFCLFCLFISSQATLRL